MPKNRVKPWSPPVPKAGMAASMAANAKPDPKAGWTTVDQLCALQCTQEEIAAVFGISVDTLVRAVNRELKMTWGEYYESRRRLGQVSLRRKQYTNAMDGDTALLIFLGKNWLRQSDRQEVTGRDGGPISIAGNIKIDRDADDAALIQQILDENRRIEDEINRLRVSAGQGARGGAAPEGKKPASAGGVEPRTKA